MPQNLVDDKLCVRDAPTTRLFFKMMQNKTMVSTNRLHYAVHGRTAASRITFFWFSAV
jgi:hypothetical protein